MKKSKEEKTKEFSYCIPAYYMNVDKEVKETLVTAAAITMAILVTVPIALVLFDQGLRPWLEKNKYHSPVNL